MTATTKTYCNGNCKLTATATAKTYFNSNCKDLLQQQLQRLTATATAKTFCNGNCKDLLQQQLHYQIAFGDDKQNGNSRVPGMMTSQRVVI
jgi:hypothetical protein